MMFIPGPVQPAPSDTDTQLGQTETEIEGPGESSADRAFAISRVPELAPQRQVSQVRCGEHTLLSQSRRGREGR